MPTADAAQDPLKTRLKRVSKFASPKVPPMETRLQKTRLQRCTFGDASTKSVSPKVHLWRGIFGTSVSKGAPLETRIL
jgi:hypothetical protein